MVKSKRIYQFNRLLSLLLVTLFIAGAFFAGVPQNTFAAEEVYRDSGQPVEARVSDLLLRMTLDEKIGQMVQAERKTASVEDVKKNYIGSILSGGGSYPTPNTKEVWADMVNSYQTAAMSTRLQIPILYGVDAVHGHNNIYGATIFPHNIGLGASGDTRLVERIGAAVAKEMKATGVNWTFAPCVAIPHNQKWGRTYEAFGENVQLVTDMGVAYTHGFQGANPVSSLADGDLAKPGKVIATPKHYIGEGLTLNGVNQGNVVLSDDEFKKVLRDELLPPYKAAIDAGARSVMISYNSINGIKCHGNKALIDILKGDKNKVVPGFEEVGIEGLGFDGIVVTDWHGVDQLPGSTFRSKLKTAIIAGIDMYMQPDNWKEFITQLKDLVEKNEVPMSRIDDAVSRILRVKFQSGLFDDNRNAVTEFFNDFGGQVHRDLAREAVRKSLVLLKNDSTKTGDKILNSLESMDKIFIAGKSADDIGMQCGGWTIDWQGKTGDITPGTTILQGFREVIGDTKTITYNKYGRGAAGHDAAIVVIGETPYAEGNGDKNRLPLDIEDIATLENVKEAGIPIIVVMVSGRPMEIADQIADWDGLIAAWLPGTEGAGVADVLFGDYDFTGKLPVSWAWYMEQMPIDPTNLAQQDEMLFKFGFGLTKQTAQELPEKPVKPEPPAKDLPASEGEGAVRIEAEDYIEMKGIDTEDCKDTGGGRNVGWIDGGDWMDYYVNVPQKALYSVKFRVASESGSSGGIRLKSGGKTLCRADVPRTGGWQNWIDVTGEVVLEPGKQMLRFEAGNGGFNINWMEFAYKGTAPETPPEGDDDVKTPVIIADDAVNVWMSSEKAPSDRTWYFAPKPIELKMENQMPLDIIAPDDSKVTTINIDTSKKYQDILGIGTSLEESTVYNLARMSPEKRTEVLKKLVDPVDGIGMSLMRICIGTADFTGREFYTYDDMPPGQTDENLEHFSIQKDIDYKIIETVREALEINPNLKIFASPWTPPGWMKEATSSSKNYEDNEKNLKGGRLKTEYIPALAEYYRKFIEAYKEQGIPIYAMTLQNEPLLEIEYPSCAMTAEQQRQLAIALKKELEGNSLDTKLWVFDHNFDGAMSFVSPILNNPAGYEAVDGVAFHDYGGSPSVMTDIQKLFPEKTMHLTERSVWGTKGADRIIQYLRNWSKSYNSWVTMLDSDIAPEQWVGTPDPTMLVQDSSGFDNYWECPEYYITGQFSKFIKPGSVRIDSNYGSADTLTNAAFLDPDGNIVTVVVNQTQDEQKFKILCDGIQISGRIPAGTVATYIWKPLGKTPIEIPGVIKAAKDFVDIKGFKHTEDCLEDSGAGHYADYLVNVPETGDYYVDYKIAGQNYDGLNPVREIQLKKGDTVLNSVIAPQTYNWWNWRTVRGTVHLEKGVQKLRMLLNQGWWINIDTITFTKAVSEHVTPGKIEAEEYLHAGGEYGVVVEDCEDIGKGRDVGYIDDGDWLQYRINVPQAGNYPISYRIATEEENSKIKFISDSFEKTTVIPETGGWQAWNTVTDEVYLNEGSVTMTVYAVDNGFNLNWIAIGSSISVSGGETLNGNEGIVEGNEDGSTITVKIINDTFKETLNPSNWRVMGLPEGVQAGPVTRIDDTTAGILLNGTRIVDFDSDRYISVVCDVYEASVGSVTYSSRGELVMMDKLILAAVDDPESIDVDWAPEPGTNGNQETMNDEVLILTIDGGTFVEDKLDGITLTGTAVDEGHITKKSIEFINPKQIKIALAWDGTKYYENLILTVNVPITAYADSTGGSALTADITCKGIAPSTTKHAIPGIINAVDFSAMKGVKIAEWKIGNEIAGQKITDIQYGDWVDYLVDVPSTGTYVVDFKVASADGAPQAIRLQSEGTVLKTFDIPKIWSESKWVSVRNAVKLTAGEQTLRIVAGNGGFELGQIKFESMPAPKSLPGVIEAEDYYATTQNAIENLDEGGKAVGFLVADDWMDYFVNVPVSGEYTISYKYATDVAGAKVKLISGSKVLSHIALPRTGGWYNWNTATGSVELEAGDQTLRVMVDSDGFNIDNFEILGVGVIEQVAAPEAKPVPGTYTGAQNITLSCSTEGASIYYTTTGEDPTASSTLYTEPITLTATAAIKAMAVKPGMSNSNVVTFEYIIKSSSSGGGSTKPQPPASVPPAAEEPKESTIIEAIPSLEGNRAVTSIKEDDIARAFDNAGADKKGIKTITINVKALDGISSYVQILPANMLVSDGNRRMQINIPTVSIIVPCNILKADEAEKADVAELSIETGGTVHDGTISDSAENRTTVKLSLEAGGKVIGYGEGGTPILVSVDYVPSAEEMADSDHIIVSFADTDGKLTAVPNGKYDKASGKVLFTTENFGEYSVSFVKKTFNDIDKSFARKQIEVLASRGITNGTSLTTYSPKAEVTRADFLVMLVRTLGLTAKVDSNFSDVKSTDYFFKEVGIARKLGITSGTGKNEFSPYSNITRQDMMVMAAKALKAAEKLDTTGNVKSLDKFRDASTAASYAKESMAVLIQEGIIVGSGNVIRPSDDVTREEIAVVLYKIFKL